MKDLFAVWSARETVENVLLVLAVYAVVTVFGLLFAAGSVISVQLAFVVGVVPMMFFAALAVREFVLERRDLLASGLL